MPENTFPRTPGEAPGPVADQRLSRRIIAEIATAGDSHAAHFRRAFQARHGITVANYRRACRLAVKQYNLWAGTAILAYGRTLMYSIR